MPKRPRSGRPERYVPDVAAEFKNAVRMNLKETDVRERVVQLFRASRESVIGRKQVMELMRKDVSVRRKDLAERFLSNQRVDTLSGLEAELI
ncbi:uncharacterized protein PITG_14814 [Phytophthora infestans T30-4]|uniref:Uncharacterized protein n=1 Tax=Phytophthora infestans (strain T30-4) TaxID=403677 RepID=D0NP40_PHYIT|nr:uncharacterized protein PITG_14814 [Phytophthora infestans T30-4]EEY62382.1 hypothetical protein PITG_14814 [Phytophthora infestans T30-4]|eukprot:XP_002899018.1 hypothetical protein PITG_14814 [Phytophthora infestans T30-4]